MMRQSGYLFIAIFIFLSQFSTLARAQSASVLLDFGGKQRSYLVHTPLNYKATGTYPLLLVFHGDAQSASNIETISGFDALADQYSFFVAYPNSVAERWNETGDANDVEFAQAVIQSIRGVVSIDTHSIYTAGFSSGGGLATLVGCTPGSAKIAGIANVASNFNASENICSKAGPLSFVFFHGTADPINPFGGGAAPGGYHVSSSPQTAQYWASKDDCTSLHQETLADTLNNGVPTTDNLELHGDCADETVVNFYVINDGGHTWPGVAHSIATKETQGLDSMDLKASQIIWQTLSSHHSH